MHNLTSEPIYGSRPFLIFLSKINSIRHRCPITPQFPMIGDNSKFVLTCTHAHVFPSHPHTHCNIEIRQWGRNRTVSILITSCHIMLAPQCGVKRISCGEKGNSPMSTVIIFFFFFLPLSSSNFASVPNYTTQSTNSTPQIKH
jgi:hypothetical protein